MQLWQLYTKDVLAGDRNTPDELCTWSIGGGSQLVYIQQTTDAVMAATHQRCTLAIGGSNLVYIQHTMTDVVAGTQPKCIAYSNS